MRRNGTVYAAVNCRGTSHRLTRNTVKSSTTITGHRPVAFQLGHVLTPCMEEQTRIDHEIHEIFPLFSSFSSPFLFLSSLTILHLLHSPLFSLSLSLNSLSLLLLRFFSLSLPLFPSFSPPPFALVRFGPFRGSGWLLRDARSRRCSPIMARQPGIVEGNGQIISSFTEPRRWSTGFSETLT